MGTETKFVCSCSVRLQLSKTVSRAVPSTRVILEYIDQVQKARTLFLNSSAGNLKKYAHFYH